MRNISDMNSSSKVNVKMVVDPSGRRWLCNGSAEKDGDLVGQGCVPAEDIIYDRMFGG